MLTVVSCTERPNHNSQFWLESHPECCTKGIMKARFSRKFMIALGLICVVSIALILYARPTPSKPIVSPQGLSHQAFEHESKEITQRLENSGLESSFDYIRERTAQDPAFARDCHPLLHHLGNGALSQYGNFQTAMQKADEQCNSGYVHGLIEANFKSSTSVQEALALSCTDFSEENFTNWQCFHGLGHGIMQTNGKDHVQSISTCRSLQTSFAINSCINGVFMEEFIVISHSGRHEPGVSVASLTDCNQQENNVKTHCYAYAPTAYLQLRPNKFHEAITWCETAKNTYVTFCVSGVGSQAMKENITDPSIAAVFCKGLKRKHQEACVTGAISIYVNHHTKTDPARKLCGNEFKDFSRTCNQVIESKQRTLKI